MSLPVRLLTLNVCLFPPGLRHCLRSTDKQRRVVLLKKALQEESFFSDVYCFQELFSCKWSQRWKQELLCQPNTQIIQTHRSQCYDQHLHTHPPVTTIDTLLYAVGCPLSSLCSGHLMDGGLLIVSRYPIVWSTFHPFDENPNLLRTAEKGFLHAVIQLPQQPECLHVINCHLHPPEGSWDDKSAALIRTSQLKQIRQHLMQSKLSSTAMVVLTGDFNIQQGSVEYTDMKVLLGFSQEAIIPLYTPTVHCELPFCSHPDMICCDYALGTNVTFHDTQILKQHGNLSDHYPIVTHISKLKSPL
jgi:endonuclease/exonuclease/phosphatase family metal-dependent hydrolase